MELCLQCVYSGDKLLFPLHVDDIATMIDITKKTAQAANASASDTMKKLKDINAEIDAIKALNLGGSSNQTGIDSMLSDVDNAGEWKVFHVVLTLNKMIIVC